VYVKATEPKQAKPFGPLLAGTSVTDPDPGSGIRCLFDPLDPGWIKNQDPDPG
jgi:hypothetical protein